MKKTWQNLTASLLALVIVVSSLSGIRARAADPVRQVGIQSTSITVQWTPPKLEEGETLSAYRLYAGKNSDDCHQIRTLSPKTTSYTFQNLIPGAMKYVKITYDSSGEQGTQTDRPVGTLSDAKTIPGAVTGLKQDKWFYFINEVNVVWNSKTSADGYQYKLYRNSGKKKADGRIATHNSKIYFRFKKVSNSEIYTVRVRPYTRFKGKLYYGPWSDPAYLFTQSRIKTAVVPGKGKGKNKLNLKWKRVSGASGYRIYVSTKPKSGYRVVKTVGKKSGAATIARFKGKKFKPRKKYYVYVKTLKRVKKKTLASGRYYYWNTKNARIGYF